MTVKMYAIVAAVSGAVCLAAGLAIGQWRVERVQAAHAQREAAQTEAQLARVIAANRRGDDLTMRLAQEREESKKKTEDLKNELARVTRSRHCLHSDSLRVLERAPGLRVSAPTGGALAADAGHVATDTDIGQWALDVGTQYTECARRLDALIDWHRAEDGASVGGAK